jgi:hypothetical protein
MYLCLSYSARMIDLPTLSLLPSGKDISNAKSANKVQGKFWNDVILLWEEKKTSFWSQ